MCNRVKTATFIAVMLILTACQRNGEQARIEHAGQLLQITKCVPTVQIRITPDTVWVKAKETNGIEWHSVEQFIYFNDGKYNISRRRCAY